MKKLILFFSASVFIVMLGIFNQTKAQSICAWAKKAGGKNEDYGKAVATDAFGNVYYLGNFYSQTIVFGSTTLYNQAYAAFNYGSEMFLVKYDSCGNLQWAKQAGGNYSTIGTDIITDAAGNVYVSGYFNCDTVSFGTVKLIDSSYFDAFVVKYDAGGNVVWAVQGKGGDQDEAHSIALDALNNVYVTGSFSSSAIKFGSDSVSNVNGNGYSNVFIAKINNNGVIQWVRSGGGSDYDAIGYGIGTDAAGNVYVGGTFGSSFIRFGNDSAALNGYYDIFVVKYDAEGTEKWLRTAGDSGDDEVKSLATDAGGNIYVTGYIGSSSTVTFGTHTITSNNQYGAMFLAKYDTSGTAQWARTNQGDSYSNTKGHDVAIDTHGNPIVIGFYGSDSLKLGAVTLYNNSLIGGGGDTLYDIFTAKYSANGSLSWARTAGGAGNDLGYGIAAGANNSLYITGEFISPSVSFAGISVSLTALSIAGDGDAFIASNIATSPITPTICMVTVDSLSQHNIIIWQKPSTTDIDSFIVYREIATDNYQPIGAVAYSDLSLFVDTLQTKYFPNTGNPNNGTYRYKLAIRDTSGNYSLLSPYHNTIFIQNNSGNFSWQPYTIEGTSNPVTNYLLMRDDKSTGNFHQVASVAGTQQNVSDPQFASYPNASWFVETQWNISCTAMRSDTRTASTSNVIDKRYVGIGIPAANKLANSVLVFPNPSNGVFSIMSETKISTIEVMNAMGQIVLSKQVYADNATIDLSKEAKGIYFYKVSDNGNILGVGKIIIE